MKTALITGITGQDGSYLAEFLVKKDYRVVGMVSKTNDIGKQNIAHLEDKLVLAEGDLLNEAAIRKLVRQYQPDEIYNLGGITFVPFAWAKPELTFQVNTLGTLRLLEALRTLQPKAHFFQATSGNIFGNPAYSPQDEQTPVRPFGPYGVSKASAHFLVQNYRQHYGLYAVSGIMYNHESERRGPEFVTRKITIAAAKIKLGLADSVSLGNLQAKQDWGYAKDYVLAMWLMLRQEKADDYVIATGKLHPVEDVCQIAFSALGLDWKKHVRKSKDFFRKEEAKQYVGLSRKARQHLGWRPKTGFKEMITKMALHDLKLAREGKL